MWIMSHHRKGFGLALVGTLFLIAASVAWGGGVPEPKDYMPPITADQWVGPEITGSLTLTPDAAQGVTAKFDGKSDQGAVHLKRGYPITKPFADITQKDVEAFVANLVIKPDPAKELPQGLVPAQGESNTLGVKSMSDFAPQKKKITAKATLSFFVPKP